MLLAIWASVSKMSARGSGSLNRRSIANLQLYSHRNWQPEMTRENRASGQSAGIGLGSNAAPLLVMTMLFWGGNAIAGKFAVGHVSPLLLTCIRWMIACFILLIVARHHLRQDWPVIRRHLPFLFLAGAIGFASFNGFLYTALKYTSAINVTILQAAMPMFIFAMNFLIFRTSLHWAQAVGYTVTLAGVAVVASAGDFSQLAELSLNLGDLIMLGAALIYAGYSVALRSRPEIHWLSFLACLIVSAAIASIGLAAY